MTDRPQVDEATARAAAERIVARRTAHDDPALSLLPDVDGTRPNLLGVAEHAVAHVRDLPAEVLAADAVDALTIAVHVGGRVDRVTERALEVGQKPGGLSLRALGVPLGLRTRHAVQALRARLRAGRLHGVKDAEQGRRADLAAATADAAAADRVGLLLEVARTLTRRREEVPAVWGEDLDDLVDQLAAYERGDAAAAAPVGACSALLREWRREGVQLAGEAGAAVAFGLALLGGPAST